MVTRKTKKWDELTQKLEEITDGLGKKLDGGIRDAVLALWAYDIPTLASCEGHLDWGEPAPWVDIGKEQPEEVAKRRQENPGVRSFKNFFETYPELVPLRKNNLRIKKSLLQLLTRYYKNHETTEDCRLTLTPLDVYGIFRLSNQGQDLQEINSPAKQRQSLTKYQQEMSNFAKFLKDKHLGFIHPIALLKNTSSL